MCRARPGPDDAAPRREQPAAEAVGTVMASLIAGTSEGLWVLGADPDPEPHLRPDAGFGPHEVTALVRGSGGPWAIVDQHSLRQRDGGGRWRELARLDDRRLNCFLPRDGGGLAGTSEAHLVQLRSGRLEVVEGFDLAEGRDDWYTPWGGPPDLRSLAAGTAGEIFANVHVGGILRSDDEGAGWKQTIDIHSDVHEVRTDPAHPGLVVAATAAGLALSTDGDSSWEFDREGLHASYCRAVALSGDTILLTAARGPYGGRAALYRRALRRKGFEKCDEGLPAWFGDNIDTGCLDAYGDVVAFGTSDGEVYVSEDGGAKWDRVADGLPPVRAVVID